MIGAAGFGVLVVVNIDMTSGQERDGLSDLAVTEGAGTSTPKSCKGERLEVMSEGVLRRLPGVVYFV